MKVQCVRKQSLRRKLLNVFEMLTSVGTGGKKANEESMGLIVHGANLLIKAQSSHYRGHYGLLPTNHDTIELTISFPTSSHQCCKRGTGSLMMLNGRGHILPARGPRLSPWQERERFLSKTLYVWEPLPISWHVWFIYFYLFWSNMATWDSFNWSSHESTLGPPACKGWIRWCKQYL